MGTPAGTQVLEEGNNSTIETFFYSFPIYMNCTIPSESWMQHCNSPSCLLLLTKLMETTLSSFTYLMYPAIFSLCVSPCINVTLPKNQEGSAFLLLMTLIQHKLAACCILRDIIWTVLHMADSWIGEQIFDLSPALSL